MRITATRSLILAAWLTALPAAALAQTSSIAGVVKDPSGAMLPGVTVEATSPALIEKVRSATTDGSGQFRIVSLVPGTYAVTFTLPGFNTVKRDGIVLTSDFTATIVIEMKVGAVEETITVVAESPIVDTQNITTRTVMTREVLDAIPTGRNIQAVGIMIPGTAISLGGGGALSRDVGGSGNLQQSPLQYRGSADTVQTVEGMRLNNLCANGAYSGVYWNDGSFQEISYITGADSAEMAQGGMRVNMVPKDGGNAFHGAVFGNYAGESWASDNCKSPGFVGTVAQPCANSNLYGDLTFNANNKLTNVSRVQKIYDVNPSIGGPVARDKVWFYATFRYWGVNKTVPDSFFDADPSPFKFTADTTRPGVDDGHIRSLAGRVTWQISSKDKVSYYHDDQNKVRGHWGIAANVPPEASAIQATPTSFVSVSKWTRTQTNKLLLDAGFALYDQLYQEIYQPEVFASGAPLVTINDTSTGKIAAAWNNPGDHYSVLRTFNGAVSYITGAHLMKFGASVSNGDWRLVRAFTRDVNPVTYSNGTPVSVTLRIPTDRRNGIKADSGFFAQDKWTINRATINAGVRLDWFIGETRPETLPAGTFNPTVTFSRCSDGKNNLANGCTGTVQNWKDVSPRLGLSYDLFGDGKTALKVSVARYVNGEQIGFADNANPQSTIGLTDTRAWRDLDGNGSPFNTAGQIQLEELTPGAGSVNFGKNIPTSTRTDQALLDGWGKRPYNWEYATSVQQQLAPRVSASFSFYRRSFANQTTTDDLRYDNSSYDGPFCVTAPADPNLPGGGGYQVCGLFDLKPTLVGIPANSLITFSKNFGGETNIYQGFDLGMIARFNNGAFVQGGIAATHRTFDNCNLLVVDSPQTETYADGSRGCHREYPYRPDLKILGSYRLPWDVQFSGTYQFSRGVQNGGAGPSITASWSAPASVVTPGLGRALSAGASTKTIALIREGLDFGKYNLNQLDIRASKRFRMNNVRLRIDADLYNVFNSNWPFTVSTTFSTAASASWLRPTNVLQSRFFKLGAQFEF